MEALLDDYDGLFDTTYSKNAMAENVRSIIDEIANKGMSQKLYNVATETHPDVSNVINFRKLTENPSNAQQSVALEFFDNLVGYLPIVTVKEENELITVTGIPTSVLENVIYKEWKTNRIIKHMFTKMSSRYFQFHSFFAVEVVYILRKILTLKAVPMRVNGTIKSIINGLLEHTWLAETQDATPLPIRWERLKRFNVTPLKKQSDFLEEFARHVPKTKMNGIMLYADPGTGKAVLNGTTVKTPTGWTAIEDLSVGDVVIGADGKPTNVLGVYPHEKVNMFEITFYDGRKTIACEDHQWTIHDGRLRNLPYDDRWHTVSTKDIYDYSKHQRFRCSIPLTKPVELSEKNLPLDPYVLGTLLGDGYLGGSVTLCKTDPEVIGEVLKRMNGEIGATKLYRYGKLNSFLLKASDVTKPHPIIEPLNELRLRDTRSRTKFIPEEYFEGSVEQRWDLLRGLMDTDGTVDKKTATPSFCSMSYELAKGVQFLVRSLGGIATLTEKKVTYEYKNEPSSKIAYNVTIRHSEPWNLFNLTRKKELTRTSQYSENLKLSIKSIEPCGTAAATCISVDNVDKLFVIEDYVVTHNTLSGYFWHTVNDYDVTIVTCPRNAVLDVWEKTILTNFEDEPKYFHSLMNKEIDGDEEFIIVHYEYLGKLLDQLNKIKGRRIGVWLDESHNLNEMKSLRTETFNNICIQSNAEAVVWASGTPLKAIGKEAVPLFRSIVHNFNKNVEEAFIKIFGASKGFALDILNNRMEMSMYRIRKDEVVVNEVDEITIPIKIPDATPYLLPTVAKDVRDYVAERLEYYRVNMREYEDSFTGILDRFESMYMVSDNKDWKRYRDHTRSMHRSFDQRRDKDLVVWCKDYERRVIIPKLDSATKKEFDRVASVYKYVILTVRGEALGRILTKRRIECFKAMVEHTDFDTIINTARKKTLIFTSYVAVVDEIATKVNKFKPLKVYGDTNNELARIMRTFKNDPKANPLIATYNSLSTAVPIIEASTCVLFNSPFRQYIRDQATARLDRLGQDGPVLILVPILDTGETKNLSSRSLDIQKYYSEMVDKILGLDGQPQSKAA